MHVLRIPTHLTMVRIYDRGEESSRCQRCGASTESHCDWDKHRTVYRYNAYHVKRGYNADLKAQQELRVSRDEIVRME